MLLLSTATSKSLPGKGFEEPFGRASRNPVRKSSTWVTGIPPHLGFRGLPVKAEGEAMRQRHIKGITLYTGSAPLSSAARTERVLQELTALIGFGCKRRKENPNPMFCFMFFSWFRALGWRKSPRKGSFFPHWRKCHQLVARRCKTRAGALREGMQRAVISRKPAPAFCLLRIALVFFQLARQCCREHTKQ